MSNTPGSPESARGARAFSLKDEAPIGALLLCLFAWVPTPGAAQHTPSETGGTVAVLEGTRELPDRPDCFRRLTLRPIRAHDSPADHLRDRGSPVRIQVCVSKADSLRLLSPAGDLKTIDWSNLAVGALLHLRIERAYQPTNPPRSWGSNVVLLPSDQRIQVDSL